MREQIQYIWEEYDVHDASLTGLDFSFEKSEICVSLEVCEDASNEYLPFKMIFGGLFSFASDYPPNIEFKPFGCYEWQWTETGENRFEAVFTFTLGEWPVWTVTIGFTSLRTEGGLSEEARADRAAFLQESGD